MEGRGLPSQSAPPLLPFISPTLPQRPHYHYPSILDDDRRPARRGSSHDGRAAGSRLGLTSTTTRATPARRKDARPVGHARTTAVDPAHDRWLPLPRPMPSKFTDLKPVAALCLMAVHPSVPNRIVLPPSLHRYSLFPLLGGGGGGGGSKPYVIVSAKAVYQRLLEEPNAQLIDIRPLKDAQEVVTLDLKEAKKKVWVLCHTMGRTRTDS